MLHVAFGPWDRIRVPATSPRHEAHDAGGTIVTGRDVHSLSSDAIGVAKRIATRAFGRNTKPEQTQPAHDGGFSAAEFACAQWLAFGQIAMRSKSSAAVRVSAPVGISGR
jgi:hypothetical protein